MEAEEEEQGEGKDEGGQKEVPLVVADKDLQELQRHDLRRGDILIEYESWDEANLKHKGIIFGQKLTWVAGNKGRADRVHAALWVGSGDEVIWVAPSRKHAKRPLRPEIVEASGTSTVRQYELFGNWLVYRTEEELASEASDVALEIATLPKAFAYGKIHAIASVFGRTKLGWWGKRRREKKLRRLEAHVKQGPAGGDDGEKEPEEADKAAKRKPKSVTFFCSEFIVLVYYQAAVRLAPQRGKSDASNIPFYESDSLRCSVKALVQRLHADANCILLGRINARHEKPWEKEPKGSWRGKKESRWSW